MLAQTGYWPHADGFDSENADPAATKQFAWIPQELLQMAQTVAEVKYVETSRILLTLVD